MKKNQKIKNKSCLRSCYELLRYLKKPFKMINLKKIDISSKFEKLEKLGKTFFKNK